ncbi:MAG: SgcJ/EcaC family oxidoreductase [Verrucomicrobiae bacterium]|nr:SgcJ/EcaC family oxidoreductase [Verrucomicrobiae bacterium]
MRVRSFLVLGMWVLVLAWPCAGQESGGGDAASVRATIEQLAKQYEAAFGKGDAKALAAMFAEDVEFTDEDGVTVVGREVMEGILRKAFARNKGAKFAIQIDSVRALGPDVAVERGTTLTTSSDGAQTTSAYTAVRVRKDGKWLIGQLVESPPPAPAPGEMLSGLAWMVGTWKEKDGDAEVETKVDWAKGGNFLTRTIKVTHAGEVTLEGWQIIGWDAAREQIRSWLFDSGGAVMEGVWTADAQGWLIRQVGTLPDGGRMSSDNTMRRVGDDKFIWESTNRTLDGEPQPNLPKIEATRVKEK